MSPSTARFAWLDDSHRWQTVARHRGPDGRVRHQACPCGTWRIVRGFRETWRSSGEPCREIAATEPAPRGWPHHKAWGATGEFRTGAD